MNFEQFPAGNFAPARDFMYLAALALGAALGCILNRFRKKATNRFRNLSVTAGFCFLSVFVVALTAAAIWSNWMVFLEIPLYFPLIIAALITALAFRFPRAAGFPVFLTSGLLLVWICLTCLRFSPVNNTGEGRLVRDENGIVHVRLIPQAGSQSEISFSYRPAGESVNIEFKALHILIAREFPLIGGDRRGIITEVLGNNEILFSDHRINMKIFPGVNWNHVLGRFIFYEEVMGRLDTGELLPGVSRVILLEESGVTFF